MPESEWVLIKHPSHGKDAAVGSTTRAAYNEYWKSKGWRIEGEADGPVPVGGEETVVAVTDSTPAPKEG